MIGRPQGRLPFVAATLPLLLGFASGGLEASPMVSTARQDTLTLEQAVATALRQSPDVRQAAAAQARAHAGRRADIGAFLPDVTGSLGFQRTSFRTVTFPAPEGAAERLEEPLAGVRKSAQQSLGFRWNLLEGGQRFAALARSGAATTAADRRTAAAERRVAAQVKEAYYEALKQQRLVEVARRQLANRRRELEGTRRRYELAAVTRADLLGAEIQVAQAELELLETRDLAAAAVRELRARMGEARVDEAADVVLRDVAPPPGTAALDAGTLVARVLAAEPELAALRADVAAASASRWTRRAAYLPTIALSYNLSRSESLGPDGAFFVFDPSNRAHSFGVNLSWNLFDGLERERQLAEAGAQRREAEAQLDRRRLEIERDVRNAVEEIRRRANRLAVQERNLELEQERLEVAQEQYRIGAIDFFRLQTAIQGVASAERQVLQERYEYLKAWAKLERWVGPSVEEALP